jgi:hypothetical protein
VHRIQWPDGKAFAFSVFDDPDAQTVAAGRLVYDFLRDNGFRTTKGVWPIWGTSPRSDNGGSCDDADYREWALELQASGFEIGYHNATQYTSHREQTRKGLDAFARIFGHNPRAMSNHYNSAEAIYWGENRLSGARRTVYNALTRGRMRDFGGHVDGHPHFWGDLCRERVTYVRNFAYREINTLKACPWMPYHDPDRPYVNLWYASSEGADVEKYLATLSEANLDRLAEEGGACIMYTHFATHVDARGNLDPRFKRIMTRLSKMSGWFAPVSTILDHLAARRTTQAITDAQRAQLEWRWLRGKVLNGSS